jgi:formate hydrogenlyase subunit 4
VVSVFVPRAELAPLLSVALLVAGLAFVAVLVGVVESIMARLRMVRVPQLLVGASVLAASGIILLLG